LFGVSYFIFDAKTLTEEEHIYVSVLLYVVAQESKLSNTCNEQFFNFSHRQILWKICNELVMSSHLNFVATLTCRYFEVIRVQLVVIDINDNVPTFSQQRLSIALSELTPPKDLFPLMPATDVDSPANGVAGYRLTVLESMEPSPLFDVRVGDVNASTPQLRLVLKQPLDHETADRHHLRVLAYDRGAPSLTGTLYIDVTVEDANDNAPKFDKELYATVLLETAPRGTVVLSVTAEDDDSRDNGRVTYRFTARTQAAHGHQFSVDASTGDIRLLTDARRLDRAEYVLGLVATDSAEQPGVTGISVSVMVVDVNEHAPVIDVNAADVKTSRVGSDEVSSDVVELTEHRAANITVAMLSVTDADRGDNGRVTCRMTSDGQHHFAIAKLHNSVYRIISNRPVDSRQVPSPLTHRLCVMW